MLWKYWHLCPGGVLTKTMTEHLHVEKFFIDQCHEILKVMKENGSPAPELESNDDRNHLLIRLPVHTKAIRLASGEVTPQVTPQVGTKSGSSSGELRRKCVVRLDGAIRGAKWRLYKAGSREET